MDRLLQFAVMISVLLPRIAWGHDPFQSGSDGESPWPIIMGAILLFVFWLCYTLGAMKKWPGIKRWLLFQVTALIMTFTLFGPLDEWAETNTAAHMTQHMLMMVVIAPLWVLSKPLAQMTAITGQWIVRTMGPLFLILRYPMLAALLHAAVIWFWHAPSPYVLALDNEWWHIVEHACFLITAGLFWWSVLYCTKVTVARAFLALLFTLMHTGFLGALLTFANTSLYGEHRPVESQQLAGLLMWVVGAVPYLLAAYWCGQHWLKKTQQELPETTFP